MLLKAADGVADETAKLMGEPQATGEVVPLAIAYCIGHSQIWYDPVREPESIFSTNRNNLRVGGAGPCAANLYGVASHNRGLVSAEISELDCAHRRWWSRSFRV